MANKKENELWEGLEWVAYHIVAAPKRQARVNDLLTQLRGGDATHKMPSVLSAETVFCLVEEIERYISDVDEHLKRALEHMPKTEQVCKAIERRNQENESLFRVFCNRDAYKELLPPDSGFKPANEYLSSKEKQSEGEDI